MIEDFDGLIRQGFHKENLKRLSRLAEGLVASNPSLYGTLFLLLRQLESELDEQATHTHRIEAIRLALEGPILDLLAAPYDHRTSTHSRQITRTSS